MVFSGAAALAHQLLWVRLMVDALGADAGTFAVVAGAFFLGLSAGAWCACRWVPSRPALGVAAAEVSVAVLSLLVLLFARSSWSTELPPALAETARVILPLVLVGIPAAGMGLVFPWLVRAVSLTGRSTVVLYAANTLGGIIGVLLTAIIFLPTFGLTFSVFLAALANLTATALALTLLSAAVPIPDHSTSIPNPTEPTLIAFVSGFLILAQETIAQHQIAQVTINSLLSSAAVLTAVLTSLALAAVLNSLVPTFARLAPALGLAALACAAQPFLLFAVTNGLVPISWNLAPAQYYIQTVTILGSAILPSFLLTGLVFPAVLRLTPPHHVGSLLAWNGLGGWIGAELTNRLLAPTFGIWQTMGLVACGYAALLARHHPRATSAVAVAIIVSLLFTANLPQVAVTPKEKVKSVTVAREGIVSSVERSARDHRILFNNTYSLGGSLARWNQERQAHLPLLLHGASRSVATLGVATGSTVAGAAQHSDLESITAIELSPAAVQIARDEFSEFNSNVFSDPRLDLQIEDARWVMARNPHSFDVVIGDLFLPWRTGEGRLFTREHFRNVRHSLRSDGLFCQWLPLFQLTRPQFDSILRTFISVFPDAFLIRGDFYFDQPIVGLVGGRALSTIDWSKVESSASELAAMTSDPLVTHAEGVAMLILGQPPTPSPGPINTLGNAWLEWNAGRNVIGLTEPWFIGDEFASYASAVSRANPESLPPELRAAQAAGETLATAPPERVETILPASLRDDLSADWSTWPGRAVPFTR